ncbi:MFS transporter [Clavibacter sepedonicus]|uniref:Integral membrane efflux protein n=1 Tax=Clavibacter sepedonicus TaxID=31964 RepID=B0RAJ1_CLASE|nr:MULTISPECIES: MFS transporter [Clavibacter]MBD5383264.1 MFS transporter [Clavibacter sp.]OQJ48804.1 MFS transporter [Clavibacter sepedonicus]OQJ54350.1 MFS transporter [Clavibacter sepedonicus]UUK65906.1 MFS transporter [Clavibacter sepedonicus]CAQ00359.1 putative integral membrane efflux protein [Clavibacter sepedonicus]
MSRAGSDPLGRRFRALQAARTISAAGNGFGRVALAFAVLGIPGAGPAEVSLVLACQTLPQLLLILVGGVVADRVSRSRLMVAAEVAATAAWVGLALVSGLGVPSIPALAVLAAVAGIATAMFTPAMSGVVPQLVRPDQLQRANATFRVGQNAALLLGLGLSGVVVAELGATAALVVNAASFGVSGLLIAGIRVPDPDRPPSRVLADLRRGVREFAARQWLWVTTARFSVVVAALNATVGVLGPLVAIRSYGGPAAWSVIVASQAVGTIGGATLAARIRVARPIRTAVLATLALAVPMLLLACAAPVWLRCAGMIVAGVAIDVFGVLWSTTLQQRVPEDVLSRVSAFDSFGSLSLALLGLLVAGPIAAATGTGAALLACAGLVVAATLAALISPEVRRLRSGPRAT